jgi:hypothetical protein
LGWFACSADDPRSEADDRNAQSSGGREPARPDVECGGFLLGTDLAVLEERHRLGAGPGPRYRCPDAANYITFEAGRLIGHNDGKGGVKAIEKVTPLRGQRVVMLGAGGAWRAMAVEIAWAGAAHVTLITRRDS